MAGPFAVDRVMNDDSATAPYNRNQEQPITAATRDFVTVTMSANDPVTGEPISVDVELPVVGLDVAWTDYRNSTGSDPDPNFPGITPNLPRPLCFHQRRTDVWREWESQSRRYMDLAAGIPPNSLTQTWGVMGPPCVYCLGRRTQLQRSQLRHLSRGWRGES